MSAATEARAQKPRFKREKLPVKFGGVSFDDRTASIGFSVQLSDVDADPEQAVAKLFRWICTRHIKAILRPGKRDDGETQGKLYEDTDIEITAEFDTNTNGTSTKRITNRLSVDETAINCEEFRKLAKRDGWIVLVSVMDALDLDDDKSDPDKNDADRPMLNGEGDAEESDDTESEGGTATKTRKKSKAK